MRIPYLEFFINTLETINLPVKGFDVLGAKLELRLEVLHLSNVRITLSGILRFEFLLQERSARFSDDCTHD
jgi:hypothetical protein